MFVTVTKINDEKVALVNPFICNKDGKLHVAIRSINYVVGYQKIHNSFNISYFTYNSSERVRETAVGLQFVVIPRGLYTIKTLIQLINHRIPRIQLFLSKNGIVTLTQKPGSGLYGEGEFGEGEFGEVEFDKTLANILGFDDATISQDIYVGTIPAKIYNHNLLYIYLDQLATSYNLVDGTPSTLLAVVPASDATNGAICIEPTCPIYKKLHVGDIHQLNLRIFNERGERFDNYTKPFVVTLDIRDA